MSMRMFLVVVFFPATALTPVRNWSVPLQDDKEIIRQDMKGSGNQRRALQKRPRLRAEGR
jgi:hypothetical protein